MSDVVFVWFQTRKPAADSAWGHGQHWATDGSAKDSHSRVSARSRPGVFSLSDQKFKKKFESRLFCNAF